MNVLFVDQYSEMGGAQHCLLDLLPGAQLGGWKCFAALPGNGPLARKLEESGVNVESILCGPYSFGKKSLGDYARFLMDTPRAVARIRRMIAAHAIDLLYVNGPRVLPAAGLCPTPLLYHAHSVLRRRHDLWLVKRFLRDATVVAVSEFVADTLRGFCMPHVVPNGTEDLGFRPWEGTAPPRIGVVGRIAPEKGHLAFVEAVRLLSAQTTGCRFVICGEPVLADPEYDAEVRRRSAGLPIEFTGGRGTPAEALRTVDVLVVPSGPFEAFPRVVVEAFSAGVPVVAFGAGGIPEIITHGHTGFLAAEHTPAALAAMLRDMLSNPDQLGRVVLDARSVWEQRYTAGRYRSEVLALMEAASLRSRSQNNRPATTADAPAGKSMPG